MIFLCHVSISNAKNKDFLLRKPYSAGSSLRVLTEVLAPPTQATPPTTRSSLLRTPPLTTQVQLTLRGSNPTAPLIGLEQLPGKVNYFLGNNPDHWHTDIPTYNKVKHENIYPGIDAIYAANQKHVKWDFILHPGANPELISLDFSGNEQLTLDEEGNLLLITSGEEIRIHRPVVYQEYGLARKSISATYQLYGDQIHFQLGDYDKSKTLVIDPIIEYSTYLGGTNDDYAYASTVDEEGNMYVTGLTWSSWAFNILGFPIKDPYQSDNGGMFNAFISKINPQGKLVYSTYLGGNDGDNAFGIAVDTWGNVYLTGGTYSPDFPTTPNAIQGSNHGGWDAFMTKLNPEGNTLLYSTCLGGSATDIGYSIAVDPQGNAYLTGYTESSSLDIKPFPTKDAIQPNNNSLLGTQDAFVTKINKDGSLGYSTYLGGWDTDIGYSIATDSIGNAYITGSTSSTDAPSPPLPFPFISFPISPEAFQVHAGGNTDAFITKLDSTGSLIYSSYLGGWSFDEGRSVTVDSLGNAYITGFTASDNTYSPSFPTYTPLQAHCNGNFDVFITKVNSKGNALLYSTFLGGAGDDRGYGIAVDTNGYIYVTGATTSSSSMGSWPPGFPIRNPVQQDNNGNFDAFITKIKPDGSDFIYSTYLGGKQDDFGYSIKADEYGNTYVTGYTFSNADPPLGPPGFPLKNPEQGTNNGATDIFALKIAPLVTLGITNVGSPSLLYLGQNLTYKILITNHGPDPATKIIAKIILSPDMDFITTSTDCKQTAGTVTCNLGVLGPGSQATITILVKPQHLGIFTTTATVFCQQSLLPVPLTLVTNVLLPVVYTTRMIMTDWRKHPPF